VVKIVLGAICDDKIKDGKAAPKNQMRIQPSNRFIKINPNKMKIT